MPTAGRMASDSLPCWRSAGGFSEYGSARLDRKSRSKIVDSMVPYGNFQNVGGVSATFGNLGGGWPDLLFSGEDMVLYFE